MWQKVSCQSLALNMRTDILLVGRSKNQSAREGRSYKGSQPTQPRIHPHGLENTIIILRQRLYELKHISKCRYSVVLESSGSWCENDFRVRLRIILLNYSRRRPSQQESKLSVALKMEPLSAYLSWLETPSNDFLLASSSFMV